MKLRAEALKVLEATSRTFFLPIRRLPDGLQEAVGAAYLCMRSIDEIEDDAALSPAAKANLLHRVATAFESVRDGVRPGDFSNLFEGVEPRPAEVTVRIGEWAALAPADIAPRVNEATATMAARMARWAEADWRIRDERDLDRYTFSVAGSVGLLLSDLWAWYDGTSSDRVKAVGFGRGLQAVNILRNRADDSARGIDFFPPGWGDERMVGYARRNLALAAGYLHELRPGPAREFCVLPYELALATLDALAAGRPKLSREDVLRLAGAPSTQATTEAQRP